MTKSNESPDSTLAAYLAESRARTALITDAHATIKRLCDHTDECAIDDAYRADDSHDRALTTFRALLCDLPELSTPLADLLDPEYDAPLDDATALRDALALIFDDPYSRDYISTTCLDHSLCPMHYCDYCACFDDDDPECAQIRACFPSHDT